MQHFFYSIKEKIIEFAEYFSVFFHLKIHRLVSFMFFPFSIFAVSIIGIIVLTCILLILTFFFSSRDIYYSLFTGAAASTLVAVIIECSHNFYQNHSAEVELYPFYFFLFEEVSRNGFHPIGSCYRDTDNEDKLYGAMAVLYLYQDIKDAILDVFNFHRNYLSLNEVKMIIEITERFKKIDTFMPYVFIKNDSSNDFSLLLHTALGGIDEHCDHLQYYDDYVSFKREKCSQEVTREEIVCDFMDRWCKPEKIDYSFSFKQGLFPELRKLFEELNDLCYFAEKNPASISPRYGESILDKEWAAYDL